MDAHYQPQGWCRCGYRVDPGVCPECGRDNPRPLKREPRHWRRRWLRRSLWLLPVAAVLCGIWLAKDELFVRFMPIDVLDWISARTGTPTFLGGRQSWADDIIWLQARRIRESLEPEMARRFGGPFSQGAYPAGATMYWQSDTGGRLILVDSAFAYVAEYGVLGNAAAWNYGQVVRETGKLQLVPAIDPRYPGFECPKEFLVIRCGPSTMLLPPDPERMSAFFGWLNSDDPERAVAMAFWDGIGPNWIPPPVVTAEYQRWVLTEPVELVLTRLDETIGRHGLVMMTGEFMQFEPVWIPPGSRLRHVPASGTEGSTFDPFIVTFSTEHECQARAWRSHELWIDLVKPELGSRYVTGPEFRRTASRPTKAAAASRGKSGPHE